MVQAQYTSPYAAKAAKHWRENLPDRFSALSDPETFFNQLGEQAEEEIEALAEQLAGDDRPAETYMEKVGRLTEARATAESTVLRELILLPEASRE